MEPQSVTMWIAELKSSSADGTVVQQLWERYYGQLVHLARAKLSVRIRRVVDEEDIALSAFDTFCRAAAANRFPKLDDRDDLWKLLFRITHRKALQAVKFQRRLKRGGGVLHGESVFDGVAADGMAGLSEYAVDAEPTPDFATELAEAFDGRLAALDDETLRQIAIGKLEGKTNDALAVELGCSPRTVKRKLWVIRSLWTEGLELDLLEATGEMCDSSR